MDNMANMICNNCRNCIGSYYLVEIDKITEKKKKTCRRDKQHSITVSNIFGEECLYLVPPITNEKVLLSLEQTYIKIDDNILFRHLFTAYEYARIKGIKKPIIVKVKFLDDIFYYVSNKSLKEHKAIIDKWKKEDSEKATRKQIYCVKVMAKALNISIPQAHTRQAYSDFIKTNKKAFEDLVESLTRIDLDDDELDAENPGYLEWPL